MEVVNNICDLVDVSATFAGGITETTIHTFKWQEREHHVEATAYACSTRTEEPEDSLLHIFHVLSNGLLFRLTFNSGALQWAVTGVQVHMPGVTDIYNPDVFAVSARPELGISLN